MGCPPTDGPSVFVPRVFSNDPAISGRRIQAQPRAVPSKVSSPVLPPQPPAPVFAGPKMVEPKPNYRPVIVPSPDELGISLMPEGAARVEVPPPEQIGLTLDRLEP